MGVGKASRGSGSQMTMTLLSESSVECVIYGTKVVSGIRMMSVEVVR
jgi:hypothetical protein